MDVKILFLFGKLLQKIDVIKNGWKVQLKFDQEGRSIDYTV